MFLSSFNWYWPEWNHRAKISIGILEFFLDIVSFNPNDDFGLDSLYLCSPIETSFGYTFKNEAKLINYDNLISQRELRDIMKQRSCQSDLDCVYTDECAARCELSTNTCTSNLVHPQIFNYCKFIRLSGRQLERHRHAGARVKELRAAQVVLEQWKQFAQGERNAVELWKTQALSDSVELLEKLVWLCNCDQ